MRSCVTPCARAGDLVAPDPLTPPLKTFGWSGLSGPPVISSKRPSPASIAQLAGNGAWLGALANGAWELRRRMAGPPMLG